MAAVPIAAAIAGALYIDAKLQLSKDLTSVRRVAQGERNFKRAVAENRASCFDLFEQSARLHSNHEAIWSREARYTWDQTYRSVCRYAHYLQSKGVKPGDIVAMYMMNRPEFLFCWIGLLAIGAAPALINYNNSSSALLHCLKISGSHLMVVDDEDSCSQRIREVKKELEDAAVEVVFMTYDMESSIASMPVTPPPRHLRQRRTPLGLLYTSGTTGLPKAFAVGIERAYYTASVHRKTFGQVPGPYGDRTYHCMPLYHGTGGIAALIDLMGGLSVALAPKFSASHFWQDCIESKSTIFIYVGEMARYLLAAPVSSNDRAHKIRLMWGNGLRIDIWKKFQERFGIMEIGEFFASTEGMLTLVNHSRNDLSVGAVGHHGWLMRLKFANTYVSVRPDPLTGDAWRDPVTGFAKRTSLEEGGEILIRVPDKGAWSGYWNAQNATDSKFLEHVFEKGDLFYRTGDSLRRTHDGYWYFLDRLGDTYRWKGENVSTTEVSQAVGTLPIVAHANVYGVSVPGYEGRAGCIALVLSDVDAKGYWTKTLASHLRSVLPKYAIPVFVRLLKDPADMMTGNNKHLKVPFQYEGIDRALFGMRVLNGNTHTMYWWKPGTDKYVRFTENDWLALQNGRINL